VNRIGPIIALLTGFTKHSLNSLMMQIEPVYLEIIHAEPSEEADVVQVLACLIDEHGTMISDLQYFLFEVTE
jgi:hypothetical protein